MKRAVISWSCAWVSFRWLRSPRTNSTATPTGSYSECRASDDTRITCHTGAYSECRITHANGISSGPGIGSVVISSIVGAMVEGKARKSEKYLSAAGNLDLRNVILLSDLSAFLKKAIAESPASENRSSVEQEAAKLDSLATSFADNARLVYQTPHNDWRFYENRKLWKEWYEISLKAACNGRLMANAFTNGLSQRLPGTGGPEVDSNHSVDNIQRDASALDADCTSKEATKLQKHPQPSMDK